jgi:hypothetical protein
MIQPGKPQITDRCGVVADLTSRIGDDSGCAQGLCGQAGAEYIDSAKRALGYSTMGAWC